ncbi:MAG: hypothetical protein VXB01_03530 [Opitutae bacterium]
MIERLKQLLEVSTTWNDVIDIDEDNGEEQVWICVWNSSLESSVNVRLHEDGIAELISEIEFDLNA